jgi:hypothetical protein
MTSLTESDYLQSLAELSTGREGLEWLPNYLSKEFTGETVVKVCPHEEERSRYSSPDSLVKAIERNQDRETVCIIENIGPLWINAIGKAWALDPRFFLDHAISPIKDWQDDPWVKVFEQTVPKCGELQPRVHIPGVFEHFDYDRTRDSKLTWEKAIWQKSNFFKRHFWVPKSSNQPISSYTTISYIRVNPTLCQCQCNRFYVSLI